MSGLWETGPNEPRLGIRSRQRIAFRRASILHLVDLKRAAHSPRQTESNIPPDRETITATSSISADQSYMTSPAALCAADATSGTGAGAW